MNPLRGGWLVLLTLVVAMLLDIVRIPGGAVEWLHWLRPDWAVAAFFFWSLAAPARSSLTFAWCVGLLFDALHGPSYPFGLHGAGFAFTVFAAIGLRDRLLAHGLWQRAAVLAVIDVIVQLFNGLARAAAVDVPISPGTLLAALTTALTYPLLALALRAPVERFMVR